MKNVIKKFILSIILGKITKSDITCLIKLRTVLNKKSSIKEKNEHQEQDYLILIKIINKTYTLAVDM